MTQLLDDHLNLDILERICGGVGVEVNISALAALLGRHRTTVRTHVVELFERGIIRRPIYPFLWLYQEYPLMVIARAELPRTAAIERFLKEDENIFSAYYVRDEEFNTLMIEYHRDLYSYGQWRKKIVAERKIPPREMRYPADSVTVDMRNIIKYQPATGMIVMEERRKAGERIVFDGYELDSVAFDVLHKLISGKSIRTNEALLAKDLGVHRKTIERRIASMVQAGIVGRPLCRFPNLFVTQNQILVYYLLEVRHAKSKVFSAIISDPNIPLAVEVSTRRYNLLLFGVFFSVEEHFRWEARYDSRFPGSLGAMKKVYLLPQMGVEIDQQKTSMSIIRRRKEELFGREMMAAVGPQRA